MLGVPCSWLQSQQRCDLPLAATSLIWLLSVPHGFAVCGALNPFAPALTFQRAPVSIQGFSTSSPGNRQLRLPPPAIEMRTVKPQAGLLASLQALLQTTRARPALELGEQLSPARALPLFLSSAAPLFFPGRSCFPDP